MEVKLFRKLGIGKSHGFDFEYYESDEDIFNIINALGFQYVKEDSCGDGLLAAETSETKKELANTFFEEQNEFLEKEQLLLNDIAEQQINKEKMGKAYNPNRDYKIHNKWTWIAPIVLLVVGFIVNNFSTIVSGVIYALACIVLITHIVIRILNNYKIAKKLEELKAQDTKLMEQNESVIKQEKDRVAEILNNRRKLFDK